MKKLLLIPIFLLAACASPPDKPMSMNEQQVFQMQSAINQSSLALTVFEAYISIKSDEWPEEKIDEYTRVAEVVRTAIAGWQALVDENDLATARSQEIIVQTLIEGLKARQEH